MKYQVNSVAFIVNFGQFTVRLCWSRFLKLLYEMHHFDVASYFTDMHHLLVFCCVL